MGRSGDIMDNYTVLQDKLRKEFVDYFHFLQSREQERLIDEALMEDNIDDDEIEDVDIDDDGFYDEEEFDDYDDYILEAWNDYVNGDWDEEYYVFFNMNKATSNQIKLMVMVNLYEFVSYSYDLANKKEKEIYELLISDLSPSNAIKVYDEYYKYVLETFSFFMHDSISCDTHRICIINNNLMDNILKINPASILDYRWLFGMKFDGEDISSVKMGKILIELVEKAKMMSKGKRFNDIYEAIKYVLDDSLNLNIYINSSWEYMLANYYEHLLTKNKYTKAEYKFLNLYENDAQELYKKFNEVDNYREKLIYNFYLLNRDKFSEEYLYDLRCNTKKKGKDKVLALKISPYYIEEQSYFKNRY